MNALTTATNMPLSYNDLERLAAAIAKSGLFGMKTTEQALVLMMIAHAEGRHPALAARDYDVIQGKPAKKAEAMMRDFLEAGGKVEWHTVSDTLVDATFTHPQTGKVRVDWDMARATVAGLSGKDTWKKFPRQMLRSRVVSEGVRTLWPLATSGLYVPEEAADIASDKHNGPTIEAEAPTPTSHDAINAAVPLAPSQPAPAPPASNGNGKARHSIAPRPGAPDAEWRACLDKVGAAMAKLSRQALVVEMASGPTCSDIVQHAPEWARDEQARILADNYARFPAETSDLDEIAIRGEERMGAG